jgi:hypothetical protein
VNIAYFNCRTYHLVPRSAPPAPDRPSSAELRAAPPPASIPRPGPRAPAPSLSTRSSAARRSNDLTPPARTTQPRRGGPRASVRLPPRAAPGATPLRAAIGGPEEAQKWCTWARARGRLPPPQTARRRSPPRRTSSAGAVASPRHSGPGRAAPPRRDPAGGTNFNPPRSAIKSFSLRLRKRKSALGPTPNPQPAAIRAAPARRRGKNDPFLCVDQKQI